MEDDYLLELAMWCHRKLVHLHTNSSTLEGSLRMYTSWNLTSLPLDLKDLLEATAEEEMAMKVQQIEFSTASCGMTILR